MCKQIKKPEKFLKIFSGLSWSFTKILDHLTCYYKTGRNKYTDEDKSEYRKINHTGNKSLNYRLEPRICCINHSKSNGKIDTRSHREQNL